MANYKKRRVTRIILITANIVLIFGLLIFGGFYYRQYQNLKSNPPSQQDLDNKERDRYIKEIGKLYNLPKDETPTLARVKDKDQLKNQPFFEKAENGDITLIYTNAKLAVLYRPSTKQIINVQTISTTDNKTSVKVIGKQTNRDSVEKTLKDQLADSVTVATGTDAKAEYTGVVVVDVNGTKTEAAQSLATALGGQVATLPAGEDKPDTDILIIAGQ
jgi:hypothetical protein